MNRDYCSPFLGDFPSNNYICHCFVGLILGKVGVGGFTEPLREIYCRLENDFEIILKVLILY